VDNRCHNATGPQPSMFVDLLNAAVTVLLQSERVQVFGLFRATRNDGCLILFTEKARRAFICRSSKIIAKLVLVAELLTVECHAGNTATVTK